MTSISMPAIFTKLFVQYSNASWRQYVLFGIKKAQTYHTPYKPSVAARKRIKRIVARMYFIKGGTWVYRLGEMTLFRYSFVKLYPTKTSVGNNTLFFTVKVISKLSYVC